MEQKIQKLNSKILQNPEFIQDYAKYISWNHSSDKKAEIRYFGTSAIVFTFEMGDYYEIKQYSTYIFDENEIIIREEQGTIDQKEKRTRKIRFESQKGNSDSSIFTMEETGYSFPSGYHFHVSFQNGQNKNSVEITELSLRQIHQLILSTSNKDMSLYLALLDNYLTAAYEEGRIPIYCGRIREEQLVPGDELDEMTREKQVESLIQKAPKYLQTSKSLKMDAYRFVAGSNNHACTFHADITGLTFWFETEKGWERRSYQRNGIFSYILNETYEKNAYFVRITSALPNGRNIQFHTRHILSGHDFWMFGKANTVLSMRALKESELDDSFPLGEFYTVPGETEPYQTARKEVGMITGFLGKLAPVLLQEIDIAEKTYKSFVIEIQSVEVKSLKKA